MEDDGKTMNYEELKRKRVAVLMGGLSSEREISLRSGRAVLQALQEAGYNVFGIDAGRDMAQRLLQEKTEVAFIALHGRFGEDGTVQGLLEILGIPYTGSGVLASGAAMDKVFSKQIFIGHHIPTPDSVTMTQGEDCDALEDNIREMLPVVIKPACEGSTVGVSVVYDMGALRTGLTEAFRFDPRALVERFVHGDEITVSVLDGEALPIVQVRPKSGFYDFTSKYTVGRTEYVLPAPLPPEVYRRAQDLAVAAYNALQCRGAARADFIVDGDRIFCLEVNTVPGLTETSLLPKAAAHAGITFSELVQRMLKGACLKA